MWYNKPPKLLCDFYSVYVIYKRGRGPHGGVAAFRVREKLDVKPEGEDQLKDLVTGGGNCGSD